MPPAARITDMHACPMVTVAVPHVGGPILKGLPTVLTGKLPQARVTDTCLCVGPPDLIVKGSAGVFVGKLPAARMLDNCAHGGMIVKGEPTVIIGEIKGGGGGGGGGGGAGSSDNAYNPVVPVAVWAANAAAQAGALTAAAASGAPFCEVCFAATTPAPGYATQDEAARAALAEANPQSVRDNLEYGGLVYKDSAGRYHYTSPLKGTDQGFDPSAVVRPPGSTVVGDYHTHGDYSLADPVTGRAIRTSDPLRDDFNSDNFSAQDRLGIAADAVGVPGYKGYLGTPSGVFRAYDPASGATTKI